MPNFTSISVFYHDGSLLILSTDSSFCDLFRFHPNDAQLLNLDKLYGPETSAERVSIITSAVRKGLPDTTQITLYDSHGMGRMYRLKVLTLESVQPKFNDRESDQRTFGSKWAKIELQSTSIVATPTGVKVSEINNGQSLSVDQFNEHLSATSVNRRKYPKRSRIQTGLMDFQAPEGAQISNDLSHPVRVPVSQVKRKKTDDDVIIAFSRKLKDVVNAIKDTKPNRQYEEAVITEEDIWTFSSSVSLNQDQVFDNNSQEHGDRYSYISIVEEDDEVTSINAITSYWHYNHNNAEMYHKVSELPDENSFHYNNLCNEQDEDQGVVSLRSMPLVPMNCIINVIENECYDDDSNTTVSNHDAEAETIFEELFSMEFFEDQEY